MPQGFLVERALLDILHYDAFTLIIGIGYLIGLAALYQRHYVVYLACVAITYFTCQLFYLYPSHHFLLPGRIGTWHKTIIIIESIIHNAPRLHLLVIYVCTCFRRIKVGQTHAVR